jgi:membrane protein implicated in regulation of membrane protease activity
VATVMMMAMTAVMMGMTAVMMGMTAVMMAMTAVMMGMTAVVTTAVMAPTMMTAVTAVTATGRRRQRKQQGSRYCTNKRELSHPLFLPKTGVILQDIPTLAAAMSG